MRFKILVFILMVSSTGGVFGQSDSTKTKEFYKSLKRKADRNSATLLLYKIVFNVPDEAELDSILDSPVTFGNRIIRNININTREPFGTSLHDTAVKTYSLVQKVGNALHFRTRRRAIENLLVFQSGEKLDMLQIEESERLIRNSGFIRDVQIKIKPINEDSADIYVETRDHWTFKASATVTSSQTRTKFTSYDLFGMGHRFSNELTWLKGESQLLKPYLEGYYLAPSVAGSFASAKLSYQLKEGNRSVQFDVDRPFVSTIAEWAGGLNVSRYLKTDSLRLTKSAYAPFVKEGSTYGGWLARSFMLRPGKSTEERSTRLVVSMAIASDEPTKLNTSDFVAHEVLSSKKTALFSFGLSNRSYVMDKYLFQFGEDEDVPSGRKVQITSGYEFGLRSTRDYIGGTAAAVGYVRDAFYVSCQLDIGAFIKYGEKQDEVIKAKAFAFSPLVTFGKWSIRFIGEVDYVKYANQQYYRPLNLQQDRLLPGYRSGTPEGLERFGFNTTAVLFNPFEWLGFKITPLIYGGAGVVKDGESRLLNSTWIGVWGGGVAVSNKFLAQSDFKIILAVFPNQNEPYRLGSISAWQYTFRDFDFTKPEVLY
ncbi:MAG: hypothetical protein ACKO9S_09650 [Bacteroidota bacterium]